MSMIYYERSCYSLVAARDQSAMHGRASELKREARQGLFAPFLVHDNRRVCSKLLSMAAKCQKFGRTEDEEQERAGGEDTLMIYSLYTRSMTCWVKSLS